MARKQRSKQRRRKRKPQDPDLAVINRKLKLTKIQCQGAMQPGKIPEYTVPEWGELYDLVCVIKGYKPLSGMHVNNSALNYYRQHVRQLANTIFRVAKKKGIQVIVSPISGLNERWATFFPKKNKKKAELIHYLSVSNRGIALRNDYIFGKLFGYPEKNIKYFYHKRHNLNKYYQDRANARDLVELIIDSNHYRNFVKHLKPFYFKPL